MTNPPRQQHLAGADLDRLDTSSHPLPLRDDLAVDRTVLANERTFLAYIRTSLQCLVGGVSLIKLFDFAPTVWLGWTLMPVSAGLAVVGIRQFVKRRRRLIRTGAVGGDSHGI